MKYRPIFAALKIQVQELKAGMPCLSMGCSAKLFDLFYVWVKGKDRLYPIFPLSLKRVGLSNIFPENERSILYLLRESLPVHLSNGCAAPSPRNYMKKEIPLVTFCEGSKELLLLTMSFGTKCGCPSTLLQFLVINRQWLFHLNSWELCFEQNETAFYTLS